MTTEAEALILLRRAMTSEAVSFRDGQWHAIDAVVNKKKRILVVQRTGWGKSSVYFISTRILRDRGAGPTIIVSPLLALMRNQIAAADRLGIRAITMNSTNQADWQQLKVEIEQNSIDALLISPEQLSNDEFVRGALTPITNSIGLLVVDEAHCISDWGHDFRPDYRRLVNVIQRMPRNMPVLGTTATANDRVIADVQGQLGSIEIQRGPLIRETLALHAMKLPSQASRLAWLARHIPEQSGSGIVYTLTKRDADQVAKWLNMKGINARAYYAGVTAEGFDDSAAYRQHLEDQLLNNEVKVLVATIALGMGYDKPDLGFVIHYQAPGSIVAYYQQVGRAGRGIGKAIGVLISGDEDDEIHEYFRSNAFPPENLVLSVLDALERTDGLTPKQLSAVVNLREKQIEAVLKYLSVDNPAPVIKDGGYWKRTAVRFRMDHQRIHRLASQREFEWREMQQYLSAKDCLMQRLAVALDDKSAKQCGRCSNCLGRPIVSDLGRPEEAADAERFLQRSESILECKKQVPRGSAPRYQLSHNIPQILRANEGRILSRWGDSGWGKIVADDKRSGRFRDELVSAMAEMITDRWRPDPWPTWITCIPSQRRPTLVPDFASRLAAKLELRFEGVVRKVRPNRPQKEQQNSFHQCQNLDGVFEIEGSIPAGPVLLVDDITDSCWTMTIVAVLLRQAGSGEVWPVALASTGIEGGHAND